MTIDHKITQAIEAAVQDEGQSTALARRIVAWMEAATSGNEDPGDVDATERHLDLLYAGTTVDEAQGDES